MANCGGSFTSWLEHRLICVTNRSWSRWQSVLRFFSVSDRQKCLPWMYKKKGLRSSHSAGHTSKRSHWAGYLHLTAAIPSPVHLALQLQNLTLKDLISYFWHQCCISAIPARSHLNNPVQMQCGCTAHTCSSYSRVSAHGMLVCWYVLACTG